MRGVSKDRAAPFSRKHRRYWIPVTGGMVFIMLINVIVGLLAYPKDRGDVHEQIKLVLPPAHSRAAVVVPSMAAPPDAGVGADAAFAIPR
jgi:hypothetical protein